MSSNETPEPISAESSPGTAERGEESGVDLDATCPQGSPSSNRVQSGQQKSRADDVMDSVVTVAPNATATKVESNRKPSRIDIDSDLARYDRVSELGRGGWGVVDRAIDRQLDREVAVKRIVGDGPVGDHAREQFLHEAKITSQLQHPGVVPVHELGIGGQNDEAYYVMKLLEGDTLRAHILERHKPAEGEAEIRWTAHSLREATTPLLERFVDICNAVAYAHERGIIHRDLKSSNVMAGAFGETIVVDWGLATEIKNRPDGVEGGVSGSTMVVGTPAYMSPEQARGDEPTPATDIYSLGVILFEIMAGRHPYVGSTVSEVLTRVRAADCPALRDVQPAAPKPIAAIVDVAMAADPSQRYRSAADLADDVRRFVSGDAVTAYPETIVDKAARWCRRNRSIAVTLAISGLILLITSMTFSVAIHRAHRAERIARLEAEAAHQEALQRLIESRDATDAWLADLSGSLEFYPGLQSIHKTLLDQATAQYERLIALPVRFDEPSRSASGSDLDHARPSITELLTRLERAKCLMRLGDLYRLRDDGTKAKSNYESAHVTLNRLVDDGPVIRRVALNSNAAKSSGATHEATLRELVRLEVVNAFIGQTLNVNNQSFEAAAREHRRWLTARLPQRSVMAATAPATTPTLAAHDFTAKVASAYVRLELAMHRAGYDAHDELVDAVTVARWLSMVRGTPGDQRLSETTQTELAMLWEREGIDQSASASWSDLIDDLQRWANDPKARPDHLHSLAHAKIRRAVVDIRLGDVGNAIDEYRRAIDDLHSAWQRTDSDSFFRVNLATAECNLGQLIANERAGKPGEARRLLDRALATYQDLLREQESPVVLRRLAQTEMALSDLLASEDDAAAIKHVESALSTYQILSDHHLLTVADRIDWLSVVVRQLEQAGGTEATTASLVTARDLMNSLQTQTQSLPTDQRQRLERLAARIP